MNIKPIPLVVWLANIVLYAVKYLLKNRLDNIVLNETFAMSPNFRKLVDCFLWSRQHRYYNTNH